MSNIEDTGIHFVGGLVAKMGFFFREQPKHDFGIDAHIETADSSGKGSGRNIAVQIKSGSSYISPNRQGDIVYNSDERHIHYWAEHSLPVVLIVFDPNRDIAWWCDVKAYISRHPSMLSQGSHKIVLPKTQQLTAESKSDFVKLAAMPQFVLNLDRQYFSFISKNDVSTSQSKRYQADILVGHANSEVVRLAVYQATEQLKSVVEHSSDRSAAFWRDSPPHLIRLFVYRDLDDKSQTNWVARSIWRDPKSKGAKLEHFGKMNDHTEDIEIEFADSQSQETWRQFISGRVITKYEFLKKVEQLIAKLDDLLGQAKTLVTQKDSCQITEEHFTKSMSELALEYIEQIERRYDDGTTGPSEVRDAQMRYVATIGSGGNVFLGFTARGLETWTDPKQRDYTVKSYLKRYEEDREMLGFELKKLGVR